MRNHRLQTTWWSVDRIASRLVNSAGEPAGTTAILPGRELVGRVRDLSGAAR